MDKPLTGVFVCECGGNVSDFIDVKKVVEEAHGLVNVASSQHHAYLCSKPSLELMKRSIRSRKLNRVIILCCTPRMHRKLFERNVGEEGINPAFLEIVNVREHCSWVHQNDFEGATLKALDMARGALRKVEKALPLEPVELKVEKSVLVIGAGVAGITASLRLAGCGFKVYLIEREPSIGGHMIKYPKVFPTLDCSQCILTPKIAEVAENPRIKVFTLAKLKSISGGPGNFHVKLSLKPRGVDIEKCVGCGLCSLSCPVEVSSEFNEGVGMRKAIYTPFPQAFPPAYTVDFISCVKCGRCVEACPRGAINLNDGESVVEVDVGALVLATGFELYDLSKLGQYRYRKHPDVITSLQMERLMDVAGPTKSSIIRLSDGGEAKKVSYILCAGSRDMVKGVPYCSSVCCLYALKEAIMLRDRGIDVWVHYIDIRASGRRYEEFYKEAQAKGVNFVKGKVAEVIPGEGYLIVRAEDMLVNRLVENKVDLVVLCPPIIPSLDEKLADLLKIPLGEDKFILERHPKLDPISTRREGIFLCGMASGPKDIQTTVAEAEGAAAKVIEFLSSRVLMEPNKAFIKSLDLCDGCGKCVEACPLDSIEIREGKAEIHGFICNGCGACVPSCPREALDLQSLTDEQLLAQINGTLAYSKAKIKIISFIESEIAYTAADIAGVSRLSYPSSIRMIPIASNARLKLKHILYCFAHGADGVMFLEAPEEGPLGKAHSIASKRVEEYIDQIESYGISNIRLWFSKVYVPDWRKIVEAFKTFDEIIREEGPVGQEVRVRLLERLKEGA